MNAVPTLTSAPPTDILSRIHEEAHHGRVLEVNPQKGELAALPRCAKKDKSQLWLGHLSCLLARQLVREICMHQFGAAASALRGSRDRTAIPLGPCAALE